MVVCSQNLPIELPIFAHRFPIKTSKSATGFVITCTTKMQKGERSFNVRPPNWKKSRPISRALGYCLGSQLLSTPKPWLLFIWQGL